MFNRSLVLSIFNIGARTYSSKLIRLNHPKRILRKRPIFAERSDFKIQLANMSSGDTKFVTYNEVQNLKDNKTVLLIDVREPQELKETGIIPGSINIPLSILEQTLTGTPSDEFHAQFHRDKPDLDTPLVFSCKAGIRSSKAQNIAAKLGYSNVRNYKGGWLDWEEHVKKN
ncbi:Rhodanese-like domain [Popillia japonica]|uniref:Rhodanese-like domain n=1 Tax=Popillia japonica TaxID=7064 RepID=A0AAW1LRI0_POPJA